MIAMIAVIAWVVLDLGGFWLYCRLTARRCPACGSKWRTELVGEWDGEMWACRACGHYWEVP